MVEPVRLQHFNDPRVAVYRNLRDGELLRQHGLFMAESRQVVRTLLSGCRYVVKSVLLNAPALKGLEPTLRSLETDIPVYVADDPILQQVVGFHLHRGCLAACERGKAHSLEDLASAHGPQTLLALDGVSDPDNIGSIFRNAMAFGVDGIILSKDCADPLYRKAIRTSMGAALRLPFAWVDDLPAVLHKLRGKDYQTIGLAPDESSQPLTALAIHDRMVVVVGNEGSGMRRETLDAVDACARIAMVDDFDSINVASASAIALHHFAR